MLRTTKRTVGQARRLRREMTLPEVLLWRILRARPGGFKFRRQHPCGRYILDFYCEEVALAIEIDGMAHDSRQARDADRDAWMLERGIRTCRLLASDVLEDLEPPLLLILEMCRAGRNPPLSEDSGEGDHA